MNTDKVKINLLTSVLLLSAAAGAGEIPEIPTEKVPAGKKASAAEIEMAAPPEEESGKFAEAQFKYGVYCREKLKKGETAYYYLELAAKQNHREAWIYLAECYFARNQEHHSYLLWSKLCLMAAERLKAEAEVELKIALVEAFSGNLKEFKHWAELAAAKGSKKAAELLENPKVYARIKAVNKELEAQKKPDALRNSIDAHFRKVKEKTGTTGPELLDELAGRPAVSQISRMIRLPLPKGIGVPRWNYDPEATDEFIAGKLMADRMGDMRWISEEFIKQPLWENLLYPNPTIRAINMTREEQLTTYLNKSSFRLCSKAETQRLIKFLRDPDMPAGYYDGNKVWDLGGNLYFRIHTDTEGAWRLRDYQFFTIREGKAFDLVTFANPPGAAEAALAAGICRNDESCLNNLAVKYADGEMDQVFRCDDEAEVLLKALAARRHAVGTYNLAVFYQNRKNNANARKYFDLAAQFAGSTVISPYVHQPEIFDRNGVLLVKNRLFRTQRENPRSYTCGGTFAATLIGHLSYGNGRVPNGECGVEGIIARKGIRHPVYLTMDSALQKKLEKVIREAAEESDPKYVYGIIVNSRGELIAAAQSAVFDLEKRKSVVLNPSGVDNDWLFMPSGYVFPVADQWMKLLGSSSYADPLSKEKLKLHIKQNVFGGEAQGVVLGLNRMRGVRDPKKVSGQMTTMMNYLYAYIGAAEKKSIPAPVIFTAGVNAPVSVRGDVRWISFYRPPDGIVVNALGVIETENPAEKLYVCLRAVHAERNFASPPGAEKIRKAAAGADKAEKIFRAFSVAGKKHSAKGRKK